MHTADICTPVLVSTSLETKRNAQKEPYFDCIQEENTTDRGHPLSPIDTSINIAYGTSHESYIYIHLVVILLIQSHPLLLVSRYEITM